MHTYRKRAGKPPNRLATADLQCIDATTPEHLLGAVETKWPNRVVIVINACNQPATVAVQLLFDAPEEEP